MSIQGQVEELLEQAAWAERNGVDRSDYNNGVYTPLEAIKASEAERYRDHPPADAYEELPFLPRWVVLTILGIVGLGLWIGWNIFARS
jgi:hypothetical protein